MRAYVFRGIAGAYALTIDDSNARLPSALGPWRRWKEIALDGRETGRIGIAADEIVALRRDGFVVPRKGLVIEDA